MSICVFGHSGYRGTEKMDGEGPKIGNSVIILLCKLDGQKLGISLGNRFFWIQHTRIMIKSPVPNFYPKMLLDVKFSGNGTRLLFFPRPKM